MNFLGKKIWCVEDNEVFDSLKELLEKHPYAIKAPQVARGYRKTAGGKTWKWIYFEGPEKTIPS